MPGLLYAFIVLASYIIDVYWLFAKYSPPFTIIVLILFRGEHSSAAL